MIKLVEFYFVLTFSLTRKYEFHVKKKKKVMVLVGVRHKKGEGGGLG